jgi:hypothetical protein
VTGHTDRFFLETVIDLDLKAATGGSYQVTRAAGLLRQLLLDHEPLVHLVNRQHRVRIAFDVLNVSGFPIRAFEFAWLGLEPRTPASPRVRLGLQEFLRVQCLRQGSVAIPSHTSRGSPPQNIPPLAAGRPRLRQIQILLCPRRLIGSGTFPPSAAVSRVSK